MIQLVTHDFTWHWFEFNLRSHRHSEKYLEQSISNSAPMNVSLKKVSGPGIHGHAPCTETRTALERLLGIFTQSFEKGFLTSENHCKEGNVISIPKMHHISENSMETLGA